MWIDDFVFQRSSSRGCVVGWVPKASIVVLGRTNDPETECYLDRCHRDSIAVEKRCGGGGTVLLHDGCAVLSVGMWVNHYYENDKFFRLLNQTCIDILAARWPVLSRLRGRGISDIADGDKKIVGTSLFRSRNYLLYQASFLIEDRSEAIERYLRHPSKEPDYRQGKAHKHFVGSLSESLGTPITSVEVNDLLMHSSVRAFSESLGPMMQKPSEDQVASIGERGSQVLDLDFLTRITNGWVRPFEKVEASPRSKVSS